jgi:hypothetical protein
MVHDTPARQQARKLREEAHKMSKDAKTLAGIEGLESEAKARQEKAEGLREEARELQVLARLEDITVRQNPLIKRNAKGEEKTYYRWVCSWQEGDKTVTKYLGSCERMGQSEAFKKARNLKAKAFGLESGTWE